VLTRPNLFGSDMSLDDAIDWAFDLLEDGGYEFLDGFDIRFTYVPRP